MAKLTSAAKRHRQSLKRQRINRTNAHKLKTQVKGLKSAIARGNPDDAKGLLPRAYSLIDKSVQKGVVKKNTARRYKSRLTRKMNGLVA